MIKKLLAATGVTLLALCPVKVSSQPEFTCGFDIWTQRSLKEASKEAIELFQENVQRAMHTPLEESTLEWRGEEITIPVVFHVVWNKNSGNVPDEILLQQIRNLNRDFNMLNPDIVKTPDAFKSFVGNPRIQFCLAAEDPWGNPTNGIVRVKTDIIHIAATTIDALFYSHMGGSDAWNTNRYLNIWIAETGQLVAAYAIPPWYPNKDMWGIVITPGVFTRDMKDRTIVHETAHYLGLLHLWGYDSYGRPTCDYDDGIDDTPTQYVPDIVCSEHPKITCGTADMTMNFMNYNKDECQYMFTKGQADWMRIFIQLYNPTLLQSRVPCVNLDEKKTLQKRFSVWPNPIRAGSSVHVEFEDFVAELGQAKIYNLFGQKIYEKSYILRNRMEIIVPEIPSGVYLLRLGESHTKIVIQ